MEGSKEGGAHSVGQGTVGGGRQEARVRGQGVGAEERKVGEGGRLAEQLWPRPVTLHAFPRINTQRTNKRTRAHARTHTRASDSLTTRCTPFAVSRCQAGDIRTGNLIPP